MGKGDQEEEEEHGQHAPLLITKQQKRRPESERMLRCMLEAGPQFEGSFQLHYSDDRGRPVVCKETRRSTAHPPLPRDSTAQHSAAASLPNACSSFFPAPGGCRACVCVPAQQPECVLANWLWCALSRSSASSCLQVSI